MKGPCFPLLILLAVLAAVPAYAVQARLIPDSVDVIGGAAQSNLRFQQETYRLYPVYVSLNYDLHPKIGSFFFCFEPFYSYVWRPETNFEAGASFALMYGYPLGPIEPYIKGGIGGVYISQKIVFQHNGPNFNEYFGFGLRMFPQSPLNLLAEVRVRHVSNADLASPNVGFNTFMALAGFGISF
ncbi:MAG: acyloxyacyl hydrolase [Deltaproteobacteria bacterium]